MRCPGCGAEISETEQEQCPSCQTPLLQAGTFPPETAPDFTARPALLAAGTLVRERYTILDVLACEEDRTVYVATEGGNIRWCAQCGTATQGAESEFCDECGAELLPGRYRVTEWWTGVDLAGLDALTRSGLTHDGWVAPIDWFIWDGRRYMAQADLDGQSLLAMSRPSDCLEVLTWGLTLGEAIKTLHAHGFAGLFLHPKDVIVTPDRRIKIADFRDIVVYPGGPSLPQEAVTAAQQQDIQNLGMILTFLLSNGHDHPEAPCDTPSFQSIVTRMASNGYPEIQTTLDDLRGLLTPTPVTVPPAVERPRPRRQGLQYLVASRSDIGQVRGLNEDSLITLDLSTIRESSNEAVGVYIVADGMGGHEGGEIASRIAVGTIISHLVHPALQPTLAGETEGLEEEGYATALKDAIHAANQTILDARRENHTDMGATVTAALVVGSFACVANIGDSRAYLFREGRLKQVTSDHSLVARMIAVGMVRPEEIYTHPQRNQIYRALGDSSRLEIDTFRLTLVPGDRLILCSDGLWEMVRDPTIQTILGEAESPQDVCETLVAVANAHGGEDNISVIVVQAVERER